MSSDPFLPPADPTPEEVEAGVTERLFDNLAAWGFVAVAIAVLYLVWATVEILIQVAEPLPGAIA